MAKGDQLYRPTLRDMLALEIPMDVRVLPGGNRLAFTVRSTNWRENRYETHCHVQDAATGLAHQLTRYGSAHQMEWVDDEILARGVAGPHSPARSRRGVCSLSLRGARNPSPC